MKIEIKEILNEQDFDYLKIIIKIANKRNDGLISAYLKERTNLRKREAWQFEDYKHIVSVEDSEWIYADVMFISERVYQAILNKSFKNIDEFVSLDIQDIEKLWLTNRDFRNTIVKDVKEQYYQKLLTTCQSELNRYKEGYIANEQLLSVLDYKDYVKIYESLQNFNDYYQVIA